MNLKFWENMRFFDDFSLHDRIMIFIAEFLGTTMFLFVGCATARQFKPHGDKCTAYGHPAFVFMEPMMSYVAFICAVVISLQCYGHISGGHFNPSLSIAAFITGEIAFLELPLYIISQIIGAFAGIGLITLLADNDPKFLYIGFCSPVACMGSWRTALLEMFITFILVMFFCVMYMYRHISKAGSMAIKFSVVYGGLMMSILVYTGGALNPARILAAAAINNYWDDQWAYVAGQIGGSILSALIYTISFGEKHREHRDELQADAKQNDS